MSECACAVRHSHILSRPAGVFFGTGTATRQRFTVADQSVSVALSGLCRSLWPDAVLHVPQPLNGQQFCLGLYAGNAEISDTANLLILQHVNLYFLAWCCLFLSMLFFCDDIINYLFAE